MQHLFEHIGAAAASPYALVAYIVATIALVYTTVASQRLRHAAEKLRAIPEADRAGLLAREYNVYPRIGLSPEQWLRSRQHSMYFLAFASLLLAVTVIVVVALVKTREAAPRAFQTKVRYPGEYVFGRNGRFYPVVITVPVTSEELTEGTLDIRSIRLRAEVEPGAPSVGFDSHVIFDDRADLLTRQAVIDGWFELERVIKDAQTHKGVHLETQRPWPTSNVSQNIVLWNFDRASSERTDQERRINLDNVSASSGPIYVQVFLWTGWGPLDAVYDVRLRNLVLEIEGTRK